MQEQRKARKEKEARKQKEHEAVRCATHQRETVIRSVYLCGGSTVPEAEGSG